MFQVLAACATKVSRNLLDFLVGATNKFAGPTAQRRVRSRPRIVSLIIFDLLIFAQGARALVLGRFGPSRIGQRVPFSRGPPFGARQKIDRLPWRPLRRLLCPRTRSQDPLGTSQKSFRAKNENVKTNPGNTSKFKPWRTFADPGPPKKGLNGPDQVSRGPPVRPPGRQTHASGPSLDPPRNPTGPNLEKTRFF